MQSGMEPENTSLLVVVVHLQLNDLFMLLYYSTYAFVYVYACTQAALCSGVSARAIFLSQIYGQTYAAGVSSAAADAYDYTIL